MKIATIQLEGTIVHLEVSSLTAQSGILIIEHYLTDYLRKALQNYDITIQVIVNEEIAKKMIVTPDEKYDFLLKENTFLQEFRKVFNLTLKS